MAQREPVIGIDLGTTNSVVATVQNGQAVVIPNRSGQHLTPSVVAIAKNGKQLVGQIAKRQAITNPEQTIFASKRLIGRKFSSPQVQAAMKFLPYAVTSGEHDDVRLQLADKRVSLPEVSAAILAELKADAEHFFGRPVRQAVITVPAYFNDGQRQATKDAGEIAGLEVLRILNEPTAAAVAYGYGKSASGKIAVFDLGGGTFDVSVLSVSKGVYDVLATGGDTFLGGEDFDHRVIDWLVAGFEKEHGIDLRKDRMARQRLKDAAERAKIELSGQKEAQVNLPFISSPPGGNGALHLSATLTREKLEELTADLWKRPCDIAAKVLAEAKVKVSDLKEIILVGGMTRMPRVAEEVRRYFQREPCKGVHPEEVVALGAAIHADALVSSGSEVLLLDVTPQSLGVAVAGGYARRLIPKNTTVPTRTTERFHTSKDLQTHVKIMVLQGEGQMAQDNELLGEFVLTGLREAARGAVEIEVSFDINSEGILSVSAKDTETGQKQSITVTASGGLTREELAEILSSQKDELVAPAPPPVDELKGRKNELENLVQSVRELIPKVQQITGGGEFAQEAVKKAEGSLAAAQNAIAKGTADEITQVMDQLGRAQQVFRGVIDRLGGQS
jgi:molecular chaperone DnaK